MHDVVSRRPWSTYIVAPALYGAAPPRLMAVVEMTLDHNNKRFPGSPGGGTFRAGATI